MFYLCSMSSLEHHIPAERRKGRAAASNDAGRFEPYARVPEHDGWDIPEDLPPIRTELREERATRIITRNRSPDISFDRSINPYRGCEHGCIYCFARPTHAYMGLSPAMDFETKLIVKPDAPERLAAELSRKSYKPAMIAIGTNTDPYQPVERDRGLMRDILHVLSDFNHPVGIVTKGTLIERDIDLLAPMAQRGLVRVGLSVTSLDAKLARKLEPRVPAPQRRLNTIKALSDAGIPVRVMIAPVIPALTDHELEKILAEAAQAGAVAASWIMLRLPLEVAPLFRDWLHRHYPDRMVRVMGHIRDMHGGSDYAADWGKRMRGQGPYAKLIGARFRAAQARLGLADRLDPLDITQFRVPPRPGDQLSLF
ncbi:radical SAM domain-containing protein [Actibacterium atlanticum]|uniref:Radical SAM domain-containing protein n=1 Tax=Actibacterium atlanticum TaxID=1461693 RepID=A0A058ZRG7_9RHOB|nr:PA0069 family radical SAM protein [Actibacterium atlanticum]KCV83722.1 radical SAM domain-containing protein [Actibacterium atlanticum]